MTSLVAIDWGSSNRRASLLRDGVVVDRHHDAEGVLTCGGDFAASLDALLARWPELPADAPVLMSGMIGSRSGWVEAPYVPCPARLDALGTQLIEVPRDDRFASLSSRRICIVPGVCQYDEPDVMRGEEIQILGSMLLGGGDGIYVLPGTHSKWVIVENGCVTRFRSFMTGELFALLGKHSSLASLLGADNASEDMAAFRAGAAAAAGGGLSHRLFGLRASVLLGAQGAASSQSWLSGLLIGAEWHDPHVRAWIRSAATAATDGEVRIVGEAHLAHLYAHVAESIGASVRGFAPEASFLAAIQHLWSSGS
ncbi:2-dehydro-3-deoxygalactonokinase [Uliginosibacterium sp. H3]|uniref:2-dehydro-3-deoxygalactonokinase n=1 Tax=Uliginosibacterium silvisoli TaxID=3114758 RepID=A0ABU6K6I0_9RHOO|nr:2-dehydro-3-deoxygalactonokinase [Uliginosibacterium sp. H3]